jgi:hypothetical protein
VRYLRRGVDEEALPSVCDKRTELEALVVNVVRMMVLGYTLGFTLAFGYCSSFVTRYPLSSSTYSEAFRSILSRKSIKFIWMAHAHGLNML